MPLEEKSVAPRVRSTPRGTRSALAVIGAFKLVKCALVLALGIGLIHGSHQDLGQLAAGWIDTVHVGRSFFDAMIERLSALSPRTVKQVAAGSFIYSGILLLEGLGLCMGKRWAEYLTVAVTASLLPVEIYHLFHRTTVMGVTVMVVNLAILWYLIWQLVRGRRHAEAAVEK